MIALKAKPTKPIPEMPIISGPALAKMVKEEPIINAAIIKAVEI